jgi:uncharacterized protein
MKILISDIPKEGLDIDLQEAMESETISSPVKVRLKIEKIGAEIMVKGDLSAEVNLQCSRCLKEFHKTLSLPIDVVYHPVEELKGEERREIAAEELDIDFYSGDELDLAGLFNEEIMLNIPMKPLCDDSCRGICSVCGADRNIKMCQCTVKNADPRLAKLKKLLPQGKE